MPIRQKNKQILLMGLVLSIFTLHIGVAFSETVDASNVMVENENIRLVYTRGEKAVLRLKITNQSSSCYDNLDVLINIDDVIKHKKTIALKDQSQTTCDFEIDTLILKSDQYTVSCTLRAKKDILLGSLEIPFCVAKPWKEDTMRVWLWPHKNFSKVVYKYDDDAIKQLEWYVDKGFNSFLPGGGVGYEPSYGGFTKEKLQLFDYALYRGWEMGFVPWGGFDEDIQGKGTKFKPLNFPKTGKLYTNPFHSDVAYSQNEANKSIMEKIQQFPSVKLCFVNSEIEDKLPALFDFDEDIAALDEIVVPHKFILPGVIYDNDEGYLKHKYKYSLTDGLTTANRRVAQVVHSYRPDIKVFTDPLRRTVLFDRYECMDIISSWTYTNPDPKYMLFIETLIAYAKHSNKDVMHTVTMLNYPGSVAPKEYGWTLIGPDRLVETNWINLSRRPDGLSLYISSMCDPFKGSVNFVL